MHLFFVLFFCLAAIIRCHNFSGCRNEDTEIMSLVLVAHVAHYGIFTVVDRSCPYISIYIYIFVCECI